MAAFHHFIRPHSRLFQLGVRRTRRITARGDLRAQRFGDPENITGIMGTAEPVKHQSNPEFCTVILCHNYKVTQQFTFYKQKDLLVANFDCIVYG